jgi:hypothetical protein
MPLDDAQTQQFFNVLSPEVLTLRAGEIMRWKQYHHLIFGPQIMHRNIQQQMK